MFGARLRMMSSLRTQVLIEVLTDESNSFAVGCETEAD
jgi:hypothetical protein